MIRFLLAMLFLVPAAQAACTKITMPTDFATVTNGTRANLKANFTEIETRVEPCMDSVDEVRGRFSGYTGSLLMSSLENLRLKLDSDASATALFLLENSSGDSLFRVSEDSTAKFFGTVTLNNLTASLPVVTNANKGLASATVTGTGTTLVMSASPTLTGTLTAATGNFSGLVTASAGLSIPDATGLTSSISSTTRNLIGRSSNSLNIGENGGWANMLFNLPSSGEWIWTQGGTTRLYLNSNGRTIVNTGADHGETFQVAGTAYVSGAVAFASTLEVTGVSTFTAAPVFSSVTASEFLLVNGSKALTSVAGTGTGSVMRAASPTTTGTLTAAAINASGTVTTDSLISSKFYEEGSFTVTLTGVSGTVNGTANFVRIGKTVSLLLPSLNGTSNATTKALTGIPAGIRPVGTQYYFLACSDNSALLATPCQAQVKSDGTADLYRDATLASWTASGTAGYSGTTIHYNIKQ